VIGCLLRAQMIGDVVTHRPDSVGILRRLRQALLIWTAPRRAWMTWIMRSWVRSARAIEPSFMAMAEAGMRHVGPPCELLEKGKIHRA